MHAKVVNVGRNVLDAFIPCLQARAARAMRAARARAARATRAARARAAKARAARAATVAKIRGHSILKKVNSGKEGLEALMLATLKT